MSLKVDKVQLEIIMKSDTTRAEIIKLEDQAKSLQKEMKKLKNNPEELAKASVEYDKVKNRMTELRKEIGLTGMNMRELQQRQKELNMMMRSMDPRTEKFLEYKKELTQVNARMRELRGSGQAAESAFSKIAGGFNKFGFMITSVVASITGLSLTFRKLAEDVAKMDDVYSDVMKTTGLVRDEVLELNEEFKKMDTRTPREELNKLATEAGKLGIEGSENILDFVDAGNQIRVALGEDLGEDAIKNIGKMVGVFEKSTDELKNIGLKEQMLAVGSAVNELGASSSASEDYLVQFAGRLGGVASQAKISIGSILGFGSALDQNMQQVEMSATALQNFIMKVLGDPAKFARLAGLEVGQFTELLKTDANEAIKTVLRALNEKGGFQEMIPIFEAMGLDGARAVGVLSAMASGIDKIDEAQKIANESLKEGTSITNEYDIKNNNLAAKLDKAKKQFKEVSLELGESLNPALLKSTNATSYLIKLLVELPNWLRRNAVTLATLTVGITAYTIAVNASIVADKIKIFWNDKLVKSFKYLWTIISTHPYAALAMAIGVVAAVIIDYMRKLNSATALEEARMNIQKKVNDQYDDQAAKIDVLVAKIKNENLSNEQRRQAINDLKAIIPGYNGLIDEEGKLINHNKAAIDAYLISLEKQIKLKATQDEWEELIRKKRLQQREIDKYKEQKDNIGGSLTPEYASKYGGAAAMSAQSAAAQIARDANNATRALNQTNDALKALEKEMKTTDIPILTGDAPVTPTNPTNPTTPGGSSGQAENKWDIEIKQAEESMKLENLLYTQMLQQKLISEEQYEMLSLRTMLNFLEQKKEALSKYSQSTIDTEQSIAEQKIKIDKKQLDKLDTPAIKTLNIDHAALNAGLQAYIKNIEDKKKAEQEFAEWKKQHNQKNMEDTVAVAQYAVDAVNAFHQMEADNLEAEKQRELTAAGDNADAREQIEKKYAQKQLELKKKQANVDMVVNIGMAIANGALAITKALADLGPIAGPIAAVAIGAATLFQIASIKKQRDAIMATTLDSTDSSSSSSNNGALVANSQLPVTKQAAEGRWDVIGADDRRTYRNVPYRGIARTGIVSRPTLMGERGDELIIDNPTLRNIRMNAPSLISEVMRMRVRQRASGKWSTDAASNDGGLSGGIVQLKLDENTKTMQEVASLLRWLKENRIEAYTVLSEFEKKRDLRDKSVRKGSL